MTKQIVSAIIPAAGNSVRMNGADKKLVELFGVPAIVRTVQVFEASARVKEIIIVTKAQDIAIVQDLCKQAGYTKVKAVIAGGSTRQQSVFLGIQAAAPHSSYFAIHDGARPLLSPALLEATIDAAIQHGAAAPGVAVKETIKQVDAASFVKSTPDRSHLVTIQTPQIIGRQLYLAAMEHCLATGQDFTDDCQLVESVGGKVFVTAGQYSNIKITTPQDIPVCELLLQQILEG